MISNLLSTVHVWALNRRAEASHEEGQGTIEYMAVAGIVVVFVVGAVLLTDLETFFGDMISNITGLGGETPE